MGTMSLGLRENEVMDKGKVVKGHQNGTVKNFRFFDYSWNKLKNIKEEGVNIWADFILKKQYTLMSVNILFNNHPLKKIKRVTLYNIYTNAKLNLSTGEMTYGDKDSLSMTADTPLDEFYLLVFPDMHFTPKFVIETEDGKKYYSEIKNPLKYERVKFYTEILLSGKNKLKVLYLFIHRCCSRFTYLGAWFLVLNCKHYKMRLF
ncbi:hypothetical protein J4861_01970 [Prevotella melaninogenica]|uniref:fimbrillin family protein n=1 Tax=Prevotella melaninogenica TaxID=28132 RepID=UPI001BAADD4E|nr:fimbrillin family protein [Prevotella melaninogenica]QUB60842.1 hypothetical protein J4861_01970 [Prevotella melaninogenica]